MSETSQSQQSQAQETLVLRATQEEKDDFFSKPPAWIIRYGISLLAAIFFTFFLLAHFISYPDIVEQSIVITAATPPQRVIASSTGQYIIKVRDQQEVKAGQVLAYIDNPTNLEHLALVERKLPYTFSDTLFLPNLLLGDLQGDYESYRLAHLAYKQHLNSSALLQIKSMQEQIATQKAIIEKNLEQKKISIEEFNIIEKSYQRDKQLFEKQLISAPDFERSEQAYLSAKRNLQNLDNTMLQSYSQINQAMTKIEEIKMSNAEKEQKIIADLQASKERFISNIENYKKKYLIIALHDGKVNYLNISPQQNQRVQVNTGQELIAVLAKDETMIGVCNITSEHTAKVSKDQEVQIRLLNYPYEEYGMLLGKVARISAISSKEKENVSQGQTQKQSAYRVEVLINSLKTDQNKEIAFLGELEGTARIITKNYSVLERIFLKLLKITK